MGDDRLCSTRVPRVPGVQLMISDACRGLVESAAEASPAGTARTFTVEMRGR